MCAAGHTTRNHGLRPDSVSEHSGGASLDATATGECRFTGFRVPESASLVATRPVVDPGTADPSLVGPHLRQTPADICQGLLGLFGQRPGLTIL